LLPVQNGGKFEQLHSQAMRAQVSCILPHEPVFMPPVALGEGPTLIFPLRFFVREIVKERSGFPIPENTTAGRPFRDSLLCCDKAIGGMPDRPLT
jgi:hypothetical protein